jgi:hypothetical protein
MFMIYFIKYWPVSCSRSISQKKKLVSIMFVIYFTKMVTVMFLIYLTKNGH